VMVMAVDVLSVCHNYSPKEKITFNYSKFQRTKLKIYQLTVVIRPNPK
jgi:hypothetical protein